MGEEIGQAGHVMTNDGVRLHYVEAGAGKPVVLLPGWSQTVAAFKYQFAGLHDRYRLIALDMRGHGASDKPAFGYTIARLSKDLHEVLVALDLHEVALLGHSMGCAIMWSYWELFGAERLAKLILVDCAPCLTANPAWSPKVSSAAPSPAPCPRQTRHGSWSRTCSFPGAMRQRSSLSWRRRTGAPSSPALRSLP